MNNFRIRRLINEYLDGEIGLADKAQLEELMAARPEVREEYERLRKMGTMLGLMPEVRVHPNRFRFKVADALDSQQTGYFTPQRAFSAAMLVVMVVFAVTFGLFAYQQNAISNSAFVTSPAEVAQPVQAASYSYAMNTNVSAEAFFSRIALEAQVGLQDGELLGAVMSQTNVYEGATCRNGVASLDPLIFKRELPANVSLAVTPGQLADLVGVVEGLSGQQAMVLSPNAPSGVPARQFLKQTEGLQMMAISLRFN